MISLVRNGIRALSGGCIGAGTIARSRSGGATDVGHQRLHEGLDLGQFAERVKCGELGNELVGIDWVHGTLVF